MLTYDELRAAYQQGDTVSVVINDVRVTVEVVGHKEVRLYDGDPAVRVRVPSRGTMLFSELELRRDGNKGRSRAERNIFHGEIEALRRGHELGEWVKHRAHLYSAQCVTCGAMLHADAHEYRGTAINSMTCAEQVEVGRRILEDRR